MKKPALIWTIGGVVAVAILVTALAVVFLRPKNAPQTNQPTPKTTAADEERRTTNVPVRSPHTFTVDSVDTVIGNRDAKKIVFIYTDYQCPGCAALNNSLKPVVEHYKATVAFVYRNYPLDTIHPLAKQAAYAAEAANLQGKFKEMKDMLYDKRTEWIDQQDPMPKFVDFAKSLGMDTDKFLKDAASTAIKSKVNSDTTVGNELSVQVTPTVYVGSEKLSIDDISSCMQGKTTPLTRKLD